MAATVPSPDAILIRLADRIAAVPQARGVPLPHVAAWACIAVPPVTLTVALTFALTGRTLAAILWFAFTLVAARVARADGAALLAQARDWSPAKAAGYRAMAQRRIETQVPHRAVFLVGLGIAAPGLALGLGADAPAPELANAAALAAFPLAHAARLYALCVRPRDEGFRGSVPLAR